MSSRPRAETPRQCGAGNAPTGGDPGRTAAQELAVYDVEVRTVLSPAFVASFPVPVAPTVVPRRSVYRFTIARDRNIADVLRRLARHGVDVVDVRVSSLPG